MKEKILSNQCYFFKRIHFYLMCMTQCLTNLSLSFRSSQDEGIFSCFPWQSDVLNFLLLMMRLIINPVHNYW